MKLKVLVRPLVVFLCFLHCLGAQCQSSAETPKDTPDFQCSWVAADDPTEIDLKAQITKVKGSHTEGLLQVFRNDDVLFKFDPGFGLCPVNMFSLSDNNLATIWETAMGSYFHLFVFSYSKGKVSLVLHSVSDGMLPEFAYQNSGHIMGEVAEDKSSRKTRLIGGPFFQQRIIVPNTEWVQLAKPSVGERTRDKQPKSATIYTWDRIARKYNARFKVPWLSRFSRL